MTLPFPSEESQHLAQLLNWATPQMPTSGATLPTGVPPLRAASNQDGVRTSRSSQAYHPHPCPGFCQWTSRMYLETHFPQSSGKHIQHSLFILFRERWGWSLIAGSNNTLQASSPTLRNGSIKERLLHILPGNEMLAHHSGHIPILVHSEPCSLSSKEGKGSLSSPS